MAKIDAIEAEAAELERRSNRPFPVPGAVCLCGSAKASHPHRCNRTHRYNHGKSTWPCDCWCHVKQ